MKAQRCSVQFCLNFLWALFFSVLLSTSVRADEQDAIALRDLFQDFKNFIGLNLLQQKEYEARLRGELPPDFISTLNTLDRLDASEKKSVEFFDTYRENFWGRFVIRPGSDSATLAQEKEKLAQQFLARHVVNYCAIEDYCISGIQKNLDLRGADLLVDSLLAKDVIDGKTPPALDFINNLLNSDPFIVTKDLFKAGATQKFGEYKVKDLSADGKKRMIARMRLLPLLSVADRALQHILKDRTAVQLGNSEGTASAYSTLKTEVSRRMQQDWATKLLKASDSALLRELIVIQSLQLNLQFKQYEQNQYIEALLAAQLSAIVAMQAAAADVSTKVDTSALTQ